MKTGDVLECYGKGFVSISIRLAQSFFALFKGDVGISPSHVAIIVKDDEGNTFVYESTTQSAIKDAKKGIHFKGVQVHFFDDWLNNYPGKVYLRRTKEVPQPEKIKHYLETVHTNNIQYDAKQALGSLFTSVNTQNDGKLFCSELVTFALQKGHVTEAIACNPSAMSPRDLKRLQCFHQPERLK